DGEGDGDDDAGRLEVLAIDPASGETTATPLPVAAVTGGPAGTADGFVVAYTDEDDRSGGLVQFSPDDGVRTTELPQRRDGVGYGLFRGQLVVDDGYVAGFSESDVVNVIELAGGEPLTQ